MTQLIDPVESPYLVPFDEPFLEQPWPTTADTDGLDGIKSISKDLDDAQRELYADGKFSVLLVFQALDAAGKDGTIRAVFKRVDPNGIRVQSFKQPSKRELARDFLWRCNRVLPHKGRIGIFNRSYYEEVLVVRVHPEYLGAQNLPPVASLDALWQQRYNSIRNFEDHLALNGTLVLKFWLKHSHDEQKRRFLDRIDEADKNWKFSSGDVHERGFWPQYMEAYEAMVNATHKPWAPWYVIPADDKKAMRRQVGTICLEALNRLPTQYPQGGPKRQEELQEMRQYLMDEAPLKR